MKLRNKKTGKIIENAYVRESHDFYNKRTIAVFVRDGNHPPERVSGAYISLAELNEDWEDYEESKTHWMIDTSVLAPVREIAGDPYEIDKEIGNWFSTREEAELAIRKLKAWQRLRDKGFKISCWTRRTDWAGLPDVKSLERLVDITGYFPNDIDEITDELDLLFGGEE